MEDAKPYLIITAGATGSGKTRLMQETIEMLGLDPRTVVRILVDDLVENNEQYRRQVQGIMHKIEELCESSLDAALCERESYEQPSCDVIKQFASAYFSTRDAPGCLPEPEYATLNCDQVNDLMLKAAVREQKNIVFEFTGQYIPSWLLNTELIGTTYRIVFTYSFVKAHTLMRRNTARAYEAIERFKENPFSPAPRLPDVSLGHFRGVTLKLRNVLVEMYVDCILEYNPKKCGDRRIDRLLLFDNNGSAADFRLIYDSATHGAVELNVFVALVRRSLGFK